MNVHNNELYHYGTPRHSGRYPWGSGNRPYQHGGGPAGGVKKKRTNVSNISDEELTAYNKRRAKEEQYKKYKKSEEEQDTRLNTASEIANITNRTTSNLDRTINDAYREQHQLERAQKDLSNMSDDELRRIVNRMNMENQYRNLSPVEIKKSEKAVKQAIASIGAVAAITAASLDIAVKLKELGAFGGQKAGGVSERYLEKAKNGGSYERKGAKKYQEAKNTYEDAKKTYREAKEANLDRRSIRSAKYKMQGAKTYLKRSEKDLKNAKTAQKGRDLYNKGVTIDTVRKRQRGIALANLGTNLAANYVLSKTGASPVARVAVNTAANAVTITNLTIAAVQKKRLRAYYSHRY